MGLLYCLLPVFALAASEHSFVAASVIVRSVDAALIGAAILLLVGAAAVPAVAHALRSEPTTKLPSLAEDTLTSDALNISTMDAAEGAPLFASPTPEEEEERLLAAMGYNSKADDDMDGGLTEAEIAAFRQKTRTLGGDSSDSPPVRFKDRLAEQPLSEIVRAWQVQQQGDCGSSSPCAKSAANDASLSAHKTETLPAAVPKRAKAPKQGSGAMRRGGKQKARGGLAQHSPIAACGRPLAAGA